MSWKRALELELEIAVADALGGGPASEAAVSHAERNMRAILDRWLNSGRMTNIAAYHLEVTGGAGLSVDLSFEEHKTVDEINVDLGPR